MMTQELPTQTEQPPVSLADEMKQVAASLDAPKVEEQPAHEQPDNDEAGDDQEVVAEEANETDDTDEAIEKSFPLIPNEWSDEEKEVFKGLFESDDPDVKLAGELFTERYNNLKKAFYSKSQEFAEKTKEIDQVFQPYDQMMKQAGISRAQYMNNMIVWEKSLSEKPVDTVKLIMEKYGVKPQDLGAAKNEFDFDDDFEYDDGKKEIEALKKANLELQQKVANLPIQTQLEGFKNATDPSGKLKHPRFTEVAPIMGTLIQTGKAQTLEDAYAKAIRVTDSESSDPEQFGAVDTDRIRQKIAQSKRASKTVKTNGSRLDYSKMSVRDELAARLQS